MTLPQVPTSDEINAMSATAFKVYENRLRRAADRQGLRLMKSPRRDPRATDYGTYMLVAHGTVVAGDHGGYGLGIDDVHRALLGT